MNLKFKKTTTFATALLFISNTFAYSAPTLPDLTLLNPQSSRKEALLPVFELEIPSVLGKVEHVFQAPGNAGFVIHIQDAHGSYEAQKNIQRLLSHLKKKYGVQLVFLEGGASVLNPGYFHFFEEPARNQRIAKRLMRKGLLSGAEVFLIEQGKDVEGFGIENSGTYRQDIELFRKVLNRRKESREFIEAMEDRSQMLETRIMGRDLRKFLKAWKAYRKDPSSLLRFTGILEREAQKVLGLDLKDAAIQDRFPSLLRILKVKDLEGTVDASKAAEEREALIRSLETKLGEREKRLLRALEKSKNPRFIFEKIFKKAGEIDFTAYPNFKRYAQHLIFQSEIDGPGIFQEIETLSSGIFSGLAKTQDEKSLIEAIRRLSLLEKLFALELTREEYPQILNASFRPSSLSSSLDQLSKNNHDSLELYADLKELDALFEDAIDFYRLAEERERHFLENVFRVMKEKQNDRAAIVTGGFHSEGITQRFEEKGLSYAEISPRLKPDKKGRELYLETMLGSAAYQKAQIANVVEIDPLETQAEMGALLDERVPQVLGEVIQEGERGGLSREDVLSRIAASDYGKQLSFHFGKNNGEIWFGGKRLADYPVLPQAASLGTQQSTPNPSQLPKNTVHLSLGKKPFYLFLNWYTSRRVAVDRSGSGQGAVRIYPAAEPHGTTYLEIARLPIEGEGKITIKFVQQGKTLATKEEPVQPGKKPQALALLDSHDAGQKFLDWIAGREWLGLEGPLAPSGPERANQVFRLLTQLERENPALSEPVTKARPSIGGLNILVELRIAKRDVPVRLYRDRKGLSRFVAMVDELHPENRIVFEVLGERKVRVLGDDEILTAGAADDVPIHSFVAGIRFYEQLKMLKLSLLKEQDDERGSHRGQLAKGIRINLTPMADTSINRRWLTPLHYKRGKAHFKEPLPIYLIDTEALARYADALPTMTQVEASQGKFMTVSAIPDWEAPEWMAESEHGQYQYFQKLGMIRDGEKDFWIYRRIDEEDRITAVRMPAGRSPMTPARSRGLDVPVSAGAAFFTVDGLEIDGRPLRFEIGHVQLSVLLYLLTDADELGALPEAVQRRIHVAEGLAPLLPDLEMIWDRRRAVLPSELRAGQAQDALQWTARDYGVVNWSGGDPEDLEENIARTKQRLIQARQELLGPLFPQPDAPAALSLGAQRLNLPAIQDSLQGVLLKWDEINSRLNTGRERPTLAMMDNIAAGYEALDRLLESGESLEPEDLFRWNTDVLYGGDFKVHLEYNDAIELARNKFYGSFDKETGLQIAAGTIKKVWPWYERRTWRRLWTGSPFSHAAAVYAQGLSRPQLFVEGNHRTGAIGLSWVLVQAGLGPFVLSAENAVEYLDLSTDIKFSKRENWTVTPQFRTYRSRFAKFLERESESLRQYLAHSLGSAPKKVMTPDQKTALEEIADMLNQAHPGYEVRAIFVPLMNRSEEIDPRLRDSFIHFVTALNERFQVTDADARETFQRIIRTYFSHIREVLNEYDYTLEMHDGERNPFAVVPAANSLGGETAKSTREEEKIQSLIQGAKETLDILDGKHLVPPFKHMPLELVGIAVSAALIAGAWILGYFLEPGPANILRWGITAISGLFVLVFTASLILGSIRKLKSPRRQETWGELADFFAGEAQRLQGLYNVRETRMGGEIDFEFPWGRWYENIPWDQVFLHDSSREDKILSLAGERAQIWAQHMRHLSRAWFEEWQGREAKFKPAQKDLFYQALHDALLLGASRLRAKFLIEEVKKSKALGGDQKFQIDFHLTRAVHDAERVIRPWLDLLDRVRTESGTQAPFPFTRQKITITKNYGPAFSDALNDFRKGMQQVAGLLGEADLESRAKETGASLGTESKFAEELFRVMREEPIQGGARHHEDLSHFLAHLERGEAVKGISYEHYLDMVDYVSNHLARILLAAVPPRWPLAADEKQAFKKLLLRNIRDFRKLDMYPLAIRLALIRITPQEARATLQNLRRTVIGISPDGKKIKLKNTEAQTILHSALKNRTDALNYIGSYVKGLQEAYKAAVERFLEIRNETQPQIATLAEDLPDKDRQKLLMRNRDNLSIHNIARTIAITVYTSPDPAAKAKERVDTIFNVTDHLLAKETEPRLTPGSVWMMAVRASEHEDPYAAANIFASRWQGAYALAEVLEVKAKTKIADQFYTSRDWEARTRMAIQYHGVAKKYAVTLGYADLAGSMARSAMFEKGEDAVRALVDRLALREQKAKEAAQKTELKKVEKSVAGHAVIVGKGAEDFEEAVLISLERERKIQGRRRARREARLAGLTASERFKTMITAEVEKAIRDAVQTLTDQNKTQGLTGERAKPTAAKVEAELGLNAGNLFHIMRYRRYRLKNPAFPNFTEFGIRPDAEWFNLEDPASLEQRIRDTIAELTEQNIAAGKSLKKGAAKPTVAEVAQALEITPRQLMDVVKRRRVRGTVPFPSLIAMGAKRDRSKPPAQAASLGTNSLEDEIGAEKEKASFLMDRVLVRLRGHHHEDIAILMSNLYPMALPYFVESRAANPIYHAAEVTDFASEILLDEGVSKNELKRGLVAALLHDAGLAIAKAGKLSKAAIMQAPAGPERERLKKEAIRLRKLHMRDGSRLADDLLKQYTERFGPAFSERDIRAIKHVIFNHDNPSIQEYEETNDGQWLFKPEDRLLMFQREADRLTMLTENEMEMERKKAEGKGQPFDVKEKFLGNIKRHQEEMGLYREAFGEEGIKAYGFKGDTLYRTATGYEIFQRLKKQLSGKYGISDAKSLDIPSVDANLLFQRLAQDNLHEGSVEVLPENYRLPRIKLFGFHYKLKKSEADDFPGITGSDFATSLTDSLMVKITTKDGLDIMTRGHIVDDTWVVTVMEGNYGGLSPQEKKKYRNWPAVTLLISEYYAQLLKLSRVAVLSSGYQIDRWKAGEYLHLPSLQGDFEFNYFVGLVIGFKKSGLDPTAAYWKAMRQMSTPAPAINPQLAEIVYDEHPRKLGYRITKEVPADLKIENYPVSEWRVKDLPEISPAPLSFTEWLAHRAQSLGSQQGPYRPKPVAEGEEDPELLIGIIMRGLVEMRQPLEEMLKKLPRQEPGESDAEDPFGLFEGLPWGKADEPAAVPGFGFERVEDFRNRYEQLASLHDQLAVILGAESGRVTTLGRMLGWTDFQIKRLENHARGQGSSLGTEQGASLGIRRIAAIALTAAALDYGTKLAVKASNLPEWFSNSPQAFVVPPAGISIAKVWQVLSLSYEALFSFAVAAAVGVWAVVALEKARTFLGKEYSRFYLFGMGLLAGGALAQTADMAANGAVLDWLVIHRGNFLVATNLADLAIFMGLNLILTELNRFVGYFKSSIPNPKFHAAILFSGGMMIFFASASGWYLAPADAIKGIILSARAGLFFISASFSLGLFERRGNREIPAQDKTGASPAAEEETARLIPGSLGTLSELRQGYILTLAAQEDLDPIISLVKAGIFQELRYRFSPDHRTDTVLSLDEPLEIPLERELRFIVSSMKQNHKTDSFELWSGEENGRHFLRILPSAASLGDVSWEPENLQKIRGFVETHAGPKLILISGEKSGVGKTTLLRQMRQGVIDVGLKNRSEDYFMEGAPFVRMFSDYRQQGEIQTTYAEPVPMQILERDLRENQSGTLDLEAFKGMDQNYFPTFIARHRQELFRPENDYLLVFEDFNAIDWTSDGWQWKSFAADTSQDFLSIPILRIYLQADASGRRVMIFDETTMAEEKAGAEREASPPQASSLGSDLIGAQEEQLATYLRELSENLRRGIVPPDSQIAERLTLFDPERGGVANVRVLLRYLRRYLEDSTKRNYAGLLYAEDMLNGEFLHPAGLHISLHPHPFEDATFPLMVIFGPVVKVSEYRHWNGLLFNVYHVENLIDLPVPEPEKRFFGVGGLTNWLGDEFAEPVVIRQSEKVRHQTEFANVMKVLKALRAKGPATLRYDEILFLAAYGDSDLESSAGRQALEEQLYLDGELEEAAHFNTWGIIFPKGQGEPGVYDEYFGPDDLIIGILNQIPGGKGSEREFFAYDIAQEMYAPLAVMNRNPNPWAELEDILNLTKKVLAQLSGGHTGPWNSNDLAAVPVTQALLRYLHRVLPDNPFGAFQGVNSFKNLDPETFETQIADPIASYVKNKMLSAALLADFAKETLEVKFHKLFILEKISDGASLGTKKEAGNIDASLLDEMRMNLDPRWGPDAEKLWQKHQRHEVWMAESLGRAVKGLLFDDRHEILKRDAGWEPPSKAEVQFPVDARALLQRAKDRGIVLEVEAPVRILDGPGTSLDLHDFQIGLTEAGTKSLKELPSTLTVTGEYTIKFRFELANDPHTIEYVAPQLGIHESVVGPVQLMPNGKVPRGYADAPAYIFKNIFGLEGVKIILEDTPAIAQSGGMETSDIFLDGLFAAASMLSGANWSLSKIVEERVRFGREKVGRYTGAQASLAIMTGGMRRQVWLSGVKNETGNLTNPYSAFSFPLVDSRDYPFYESHMMHVIPGKGKEPVDRGLMTVLWGDLLKDKDAEAMPLFRQLVVNAHEYMEALARKDMATVVEVVNREVDIRNALHKRWLTLAMMSAREQPEYARKYTQLLNTHPLLIKYRQIYGDSLSDNSPYAREVRDLIEAGRKEGIALMPLGQGGPGTVLIAISSQPNVLQNFLERQGYGAFPGKGEDPKGYAPLKITNKRVELRGFKELGLTEPAAPSEAVYSQLTGKFSVPPVQTSPITSISQVSLPQPGSLPNKKILLVYGGLGAVVPRLYKEAFIALKDLYNIEIHALGKQPSDQAWQKIRELGLPYTAYHTHPPAVKPDGVLIVTRPDSHLDVLKWAAENGIPAFVEKPLGLPQHIGGIQTLYQANPDKMMAIEFFLDNPAVLEAVRLLNEGHIGNLKAITGRAIESNPVEPGREWLLKPEISGGGIGMMDIMVHLFAMGELGIQGQGLSFSDFAVDPQKTLLFRYDGASPGTETYARVEGKIKDVAVSLSAGKGVHTTAYDMAFEGAYAKLEVDLGFGDTVPSVTIKDLKGNILYRKEFSDTKDIGYHSTVRKIFDSLQGLGHVNQVERDFRLKVTALSVQVVDKIQQTIGAHYHTHPLGQNPHQGMPTSGTQTSQGTISNSKGLLRGSAGSQTARAEGVPPGNGTSAESLGEINPALLDEMRMNLDPRWGPDAEKLWQKHQRQESWTAADNTLYEKILGRYNRIVKSDDTEYQRHPEIVRAIKGSTVIASTMEAMLSGTRLNGEVNVLGEVDALWQSMDGKLEDSSHLDALNQAIGSLKSRVIEGKFVSNFNGGLGVLMGDEFGGWADLGAPSSLSAADEKEKGNFLAFGLFYKHGVFISSVDAKGRQRLTFPFQDQKTENPVTETLQYPAGHAKAGQDVVLQIPLKNGHTGKVEIEVAKVGRVKMLLFNPDIPENDNNPLFREATGHVYKGKEGTDERFIQEWILGVGTIEIIKEFGLNPGALHLNESASAFALPALMKYYMDKEGVDDDRALEMASNNLVFTTHTLEPEALGHYSQYTVSLNEYFKTLFGDEETARWFLEMASDNGEVYPARWLIQQAKRRNAVSTLNAREATKNFTKPFDGITNGVRRPFWQAEKLQDLIETLPSGVDDLLDPQDPGHRGMWEQLNPGRPVALGAKGIPDETLRDNKLEMKRRMIGLVRLYKAEALIQDIKEWEAKNERDKPRLAKHPDEKLAAKVARREERLKVMRERLKNIPQLLDENKLTLTWARRIVGYKRLFFAMTGEFLPEIEERIKGGNLSDEDIEKLVLSLKERGAFNKFQALIQQGAQFVFAGKTHPEYKEGLVMLRLLHSIIQHFGWEQSVVYVPGYDERLAKALVQGSDIWFASSEIPREASGTSGQKAMMNGTVLLSTNDGFARDGVEHRVNGLIYGKDKAPPVDSIARKQYVADEYANWHQVMGEALAMYGSQDSRAWTNLMRASIYYSSRVFGMEGVELGRIVPPEGEQTGYMQRYSGAASDSSREIFIMRFKNHEPKVKIQASASSDKAEVRVEANIAFKGNFDPAGFDYYFWYGKTSAAVWEPTPAEVAISEGELAISAKVEIPREDRETTYGVTYFAVPKGTPVIGVSKDHWGLGNAIWRTRKNNQDVYFQMPAAPAQGASLGMPTIGGVLEKYRAMLRQGASAYEVIGKLFEEARALHPGPLQSEDAGTSRWEVLGQSPEKEARMLSHRHHDPKALELFQTWVFDELFEDGQLKKHSWGIGIENGDLYERFPDAHFAGRVIEVIYIISKLLAVPTFDPIRNFNNWEVMAEILREIEDPASLYHSQWTKRDYLIYFLATHALTSRAGDYEKRVEADLYEFSKVWDDNPDIQSLMEDLQGYRPDILDIMNRWQEPAVNRRIHEADKLLGETMFEATSRLVQSALLQMPDVKRLLIVGGAGHLEEVKAGIREWLGISPTGASLGTEQQVIADLRPMLEQILGGEKVYGNSKKTPAKPLREFLTDAHIKELIKLEVLNGNAVESYLLASFQRENSNHKRNEFTTLIQRGSKGEKIAQFLAGHEKVRLLRGKPAAVPAPPTPAAKTTTGDWAQGEGVSYDFTYAVTGYHRTMADFQIREPYILEVRQDAIDRGVAPADVLLWDEKIFSASDLEKTLIEPLAGAYFQFTQQGKEAQAQKLGITVPDLNILGQFSIAWTQTPKLENFVKDPRWEPAFKIIAAILNHIPLEWVEAQDFKARLEQFATDHGMKIIREEFTVDVVKSKILRDLHSQLGLKSKLEGNEANYRNHIELFSQYQKQWLEARFQAKLLQWEKIKSEKAATAVIFLEGPGHFFEHEKFKSEGFRLVSFEQPDVVQAAYFNLDPVHADILNDVKELLSPLVGAQEFAYRLAYNLLSGKELAAEIDKEPTAILSFSEIQSLVKWISDRRLPSGLHRQVQEAVIAWLRENRPWREEYDALLEGRWKAAEHLTHKPFVKAASMGTQPLPKLPHDIRKSIQYEGLDTAVRDSIRAFLDEQADTKNFLIRSEEKLVMRVEPLKLGFWGWLRKLFLRLMRRYEPYRVTEIEAVRGKDGSVSDQFTLYLDFAILKTDDKKIHAVLNKVLPVLKSKFKHAAALPQQLHMGDAEFQREMDERLRVLELSLPGVSPAGYQAFLNYPEALQTLKADEDIKAIQAKFPLSKVAKIAGGHGASLGEKADSEAREFLAREGRNLEAVLEVAIRLTDGILYIKGRPEALRWAMEKLGLFKAQAKSDADTPLSIRRFNDGVLDEAILKYLGRDSKVKQTAHGNMSLIVFDQVFDIKLKDVQKMTAAFANQLEGGDLVAMVWKGKMPNGLRELHRLQAQKNIEVRAVREELAGVEIPHWTKRFRESPLVVSTLKRGMVELDVQGGKILLDVEKLGINPLKILGLLRQIGDDVEAFKKLGFEQDAENGYWIVGAQFAEVIRKLDAERMGSTLTGKAA